MSDPDDYAVALAMVMYGGSFVKALGQAWSKADAVNSAKLKAAFPAEWEKYRELAQMQARTKTGPA